MDMLIRGVSDELHRALKHEAIDRGVTMNALLLERLMGYKAEGRKVAARPAAAQPVSTHFHPDPKSGVR